jgi:hypothetical protein
LALIKVIAGIQAESSLIYTTKKTTVNLSLFSCSPQTAFLKTQNPGLSSLGKYSSLEGDRLFL